MIFGLSTITDDKVYSVCNYCFLPLNVIQRPLRAVVPRIKEIKKIKSLWTLKLYEFYIYNNYILQNVSGKLVTGMFPLSTVLSGMHNDSE